MPRAPRPQPSGPKALKGSDEAKRKAAVILEAMCGLRTTQSASDELGVALVRYYVLETRMLQAMIDALEPKARGRQRSIASELQQLRDENRRLERDAMRLQALHRITQRAVGVQAEPRTAAKGKGKAAGKAGKTRRVRRQSRGERVLATLRSTNGAAATVPSQAGATVSGTETQGGA